MPRWSYDLQKRLEALQSQQSLDRSLRASRAWWRKRHGRPDGSKTQRWVSEIYRDEYKRRGLPMPKKVPKKRESDQEAHRRELAKLGRFAYDSVRKRLFRRSVHKKV